MGYFEDIGRETAHATKARELQLEAKARGRKKAAAAKKAAAKKESK